MTKKYYVTLKMLRERDACDSACARFKRLFGDKAEVTAENVKKWRDASEAAGYVHQDPGYIIWYELDGFDDLEADFTKYVGEGFFNDATEVVGKSYSPERCAEAIRQVLREVRR
jgi:hypothetical protein